MQKKVSDSDEKQKGNNINQVISSIAHELKTPLSVISSNLQLLKKINNSTDPDLANDAFQLCEEAVGIMNHFIGNIYYLYRLNRGLVNLNIRSVNLNDFFESCFLEKSFPGIYKKRIRLDYELNQSSIIIDEDLLLMIFKVLTDNALKFSAETVSVVVLCENNLLKAEIVDRGIGIPEDELNYVFDPFYRGSNIKFISGSGLGLTIANRIIKMLKGKISVHSKVGEGTKIILEIPDYES